MTPEEIKQFQEWGQPLPTREAHVKDSYESPAGDNLKPLKPRNWRMQGNKLIADTDFGPLVNFLPTDLILTGVDKDNRPILTKITT